MSERTYPYAGWVLTPAFVPKSVVFVAAAHRVSFYEGPGYDESDSGKRYSVGEIHTSPEAAIAAGRRRINEQRAELDKRRAKIDARAKNLDRALKKLRAGDAK